MKKYWYVVVLAVSLLLLAGCIPSFNEPPSTPSSPNPAHGATGVPIDVTLSWQASDPDGDTLKFDLYLGTTEANLELIAQDLTTKSYKPVGLEYNTTYYWKVVAEDPDGETAPSPVWNFTTSVEPNMAPTVPSNPNPAPGATGVSVTPTLSWQASDPDDDVLTYDLYFGEAQDSLSVKVSNLSTNSYTLTESLENGTTYYWKVVAKDGRGGQTEGPVWSFMTIEPGTFLAIAYNAGPAVEGANVVVKSGNDVLAQGVTNEDGEVTLDVANFPEKVDVEIRKEGYALSKIEGLKVTDFVNNIKEVQLREAKLYPDPDTQTFPEVSLTFFDMNGAELDITNITDNFTLRVDVESENHPSAVYAKIGNVPGASFFGGREFAPDTSTATFTNIDVSNFYGEVPLYVVFYDYNDNRVEKIEYLTINREVEEVEEELFVPFSWVDFGYVNLVSYTRNQGVEFYSKDNLLETMAEKFDSTNDELSQDFNPMKNFGKSLEAAPEGTNLWVEVSWVDYDSLYVWGLIGPNVIRPDGYNIYRSFDGVHYTKIGVAESGSFRDSSAQNAPNKEVWYAVSSFRGEEESELVELGSIVPLDSFNVDLKSPADREKDVSRQPTFVWEPTKELTSPESEVEYYYTMWIYDLVQSENFILPGILEGTTVILYDFMTLGAEEISVTFLGSEGSSEYDDLSWFLYLPDGIYYYEDDKLEPTKTYDWGVDYAYAVSYDVDSFAYSIAIDYGWGIDPVGGVMPEMHNEFTTGN
ncbi:MULTISPECIES: hypothetical protein [unclassified Petrotoga]|uniref:fibronectin type III domain-containing protein n=1 Tax=unclassified Petrotoga TaxID=2620614 RepID=UPI000CA06FB2|nr:MULTISPECIES: hypothetical protein [unclassified Petrotoga]PNR93134.1 hypothetical protein X926_04270 [Petrotoga sp. HWHPT.55.6.3]